MLIIEYPANKLAPFNALHRSSNMRDVNSTVEAMRVTASKTEKCNDISLPMPHPTRTMRGVTKSAICIAEPMETAKARSICFRRAKMMPETSSAAFPTMGKMIKPTMVLEIGEWSTKWSIVSTREPPQSDINTVEIIRMRMEQVLCTHGILRMRLSVDMNRANLLV